MVLYLPYHHQYSDRCRISYFYSKIDTLPLFRYASKKYAVSDAYFFLAMDRMIFIRLTVLNGFN